MPANASIYLPCDRVDLRKQFDGVATDGGLLRKPTYFEFALGQSNVRFNVMPANEIPRHLAGFIGYIRQLADPATNKADAEKAISLTRTVLGLVTDHEFGDNHAIWAALFKIADAYDGYVFAYDSVQLPSGAVIVGPLRAENEESAN